jgi:hypothetical protein
VLKRHATEQEDLLRKDVEALKNRLADQEDRHIQEKASMRQSFDEQERIRRGETVFRRAAEVNFEQVWETVQDNNFI